MSARFYEHDVKVKLKDRRKLSAFLDDVVATHSGLGKKVQLEYIFCSDAFLLEINQKYLHHETLTDIITFDLSDDKPALRGEIYISVERVAENAEKFGVAFSEELHRVIFHGLLHLCGYGDKTAADKKRMRTLETDCLRQYGLLS